MKLSPFSWSFSDVLLNRSWGKNMIGAGAVLVWPPPFFSPGSAKLVAEIWGSRREIQGGTEFHVSFLYVLGSSWEVLGRFLGFPTSVITAYHGQYRTGCYRCPQRDFGSPQTTAATTCVPPPPPLHPSPPDSAQCDLPSSRIRPAGAPPRSSHSTVMFEPPTPVCC